MTYNPTVEQLYAPEVDKYIPIRGFSPYPHPHPPPPSMLSLQVGPANPFKTRQQLAEKNTLSGFVEPAHFDKFQFENQRRTFHSYGKIESRGRGGKNRRQGEERGSEEMGEDRALISVFSVMFQDMHWIRPPWQQQLLGKIIHKYNHNTLFLPIYIHLVLLVIRYVRER